MLGEIIMTAIKGYIFIKKKNEKFFEYISYVFLFYYNNKEINYLLTIILLIYIYYIFIL